MAQIDNPLTYKKDKLVELLNQKIAEREADRAAKKAANDEKNQAAVAALTSALDNESFIVWLASRVKDMVGVMPGEPSFAVKVEETWPTAPGFGGEPDAAIKRLVRVYENSEDESVKVYVTDEVFNWL